MPEGGNGTGNSSSSSASSSTGGLYVSASNTLPQSPRGSLGDNINSDYSPQHSPQSSLNSNVEAQQSAIYYSTSSQGNSNLLIQTTTPLIYSKSVISSSSPTYPMTSASSQSPTPHTPTGIPDIILTGKIGLFFMGMKHCLSTLDQSV